MFLVLWEMLMGEHLFEGETASHTVADVLYAPIDFSKLPASTPSALIELVKRCHSYCRPELAAMDRICCFGARSFIEPETFPANLVGPEREEFSAMWGCRTRIDELSRFRPTVIPWPPKAVNPGPSISGYMIWRVVHRHASPSMAWVRIHDTLLGA